jgi:superfamily II DNA or RNA helicase
MGIAKKFEDFFDNEDRNVGQRLYQRGSVKIQESEAQWVDALVQDKDDYEVYLHREKGAVRFACDCDEYLDFGGTCAHVYATMLAADAEGKTQQWETSRSLDLIPEDDPDDFDEDDGLVINLDRDAFSPRRPTATRSKSAGQKKGGGSTWRKSLGTLKQALESVEQANSYVTAWPPGRQLLYVVDGRRTLEGQQGLIVEIDHREKKKDGTWGKAKRQPIRSDEIRSIPDAADREILSMLVGAKSAASTYSSYYYSNYDYGGASSSFRLGDTLLAPMVERMCRTGRCMFRMDEGQEPEAINWDTAGPWELWVVARQDGDGERYLLTGEFRRGQEQMLLSEPRLMVAGGLLFARGLVAPLDDGGAFPWAPILRVEKQIEIPAKDREELLQQMLSLPKVPRLDLPEDLRIEEVKVAPRPRLRIHKPKNRYYYGSEKLEGELSFDYDGAVVPFEEPGRGIYQADKRRLILRDPDFERDAAAELRVIGFRTPTGYGGHTVFELAPNNLPVVIRKLSAENWYIEADGKLYRQPGQIKVEVTSGIDWFELHGTADFGGQSVKLPELLAALRRGEKMVRLDDGTFGVMPEQWLAKYGLLADMGSAQEDHIRFGKAQVGVLDALLASQPEAVCDAVFEAARDRLRNFSGVVAVDAPPLFTGTLRPYQREGLGWMEFLRDFGFGGCLADDMGLGKTVQVLALLESRRNGDAPAANGKIPSLVVAPRSLVFNWREEATKFAPNLKVLDHTGIGRAKSAEAFKDYDLVLTTYGTLRNDAVFLKDVQWDYVVIDEAQAIKNASSEAAKATRLLQGRHRLALSGTPVQNHLGELWSLFEFLNPGMLGTSRVFQSATGGAKIVEESTRQLLSRALRPFILRRTKQQVAKDLPDRVEQTIHCELDAEQRKLYDELKEHYRVSLLSRIATEGIKKAKIQILEALLRLRQAACHPGLIDKNKTSMGSAKLDSLLANLSEVMEEGHKVLVFSQFTSFLSIVRNRLDKDKVQYQYLDGKTRDRQSVVDKFQNDPACKLFLISLKAGGLGLNLTAAEYVYLLDPWWNPAVEAQAIDRAHRIGQTRQVFAYRLIAKDTVEEKVLQLQQTKRDLADAIIGADNSLIGKLGRDDLELLLS